MANATIPLGKVALTYEQNRVVNDYEVNVGTLRMVMGVSCPTTIVFLILSRFNLNGYFIISQHKTLSM